MEASAKEEAKQKVRTQRNGEDPPMPSREAEQQRLKCFECSLGGFLHLGHNVRSLSRSELRGIRASQRTQTKV